jgi:hypothetical protein
MAVFHSETLILEEGAICSAVEASMVLLCRGTIFRRFFRGNGLVSGGREPSLWMSRDH